MNNEGKGKDGLIARENLIIEGDGLLDEWNKKNDAKKSDKFYGKYKGKHDDWI